MTNLKTANIGFNKYCGPAVLSILTGKSTDECARVISSINGKYNVTGVYLNDLLQACNKLGFDQFNMEESGSLFRVLTSLSRKNNAIYIVTLKEHFVCVEVNDSKIYFCDNHTKEPIPAASSARMMQHVEAVHKVVERKKKVYKTIEKKIYKEIGITPEKLVEMLATNGLTHPRAIVKVIANDEIDWYVLKVSEEYTEVEQVEVKDEN